MLPASALRLFLSRGGDPYPSPSRPLLTSIASTALRRRDQQQDVPGPGNGRANEVQHNLEARPRRGESPRSAESLGHFVVSKYSVVRGSMNCVRVPGERRGCGWSYRLLAPRKDVSHSTCIHTPPYTGICDADPDTGATSRGIVEMK